MASSMPVWPAQRSRIYSPGNGVTAVISLGKHESDAAGGTDRFSRNIFSAVPAGAGAPTSPSVRLAELSTPYSEQAILGVERDLDPRPYAYRLIYLEPRNTSVQRSRPEHAHGDNYRPRTLLTTANEPRGRAHTLPLSIGVGESTARGPTRPLARSMRMETASSVSMTRSPCRYRSGFPTGSGRCFIYLVT